jgi:hypothetical protein
MRTMHLPNIPVATQSHKECNELYSERLLANDARWPNASLFLTAYLAWPNDEERRNSFVATHLVRFSGPSVEKTSDASHDSQTSTSLGMFGGISAIAKPAFDQLINEIGQVQRKWLLTADIFQSIVDMAFDKRIAVRGGASVSKAVELCEIERGLPGHSQLRAA